MTMAPSSVFEVIPDTEYDPMIWLELPDGQEFAADEQPLRRFSGYFERILLGITNPYYFYFPKSCESQIAALFCNWFEREGHFILKSHPSWTDASSFSLEYHAKVLDFITLAKLWLFSEEYETPAIQNHVMNILIVKLLKNPTQYPAEVDALISEKSPQESKLRMFNDGIRDDIVIFKHAQKRLEQIDKNDTSKLEFQEQIIKARKRLHWTVGGRTDAGGSSLFRGDWQVCVLHVHPEGVQCPHNKSIGRNGWGVLTVNGALAP